MRGHGVHPAPVSDSKLGARQTPRSPRDAVIKDLVRCGYVKSADLTDRFGDPSALNPELDPDIVGAGGIFTQAEFDSDDEFRKTAAVMKLVINGYAGAGTITMGGYDYHGRRRATARCATSAPAAAWAPASSTPRASACP